MGPPDSSVVAGGLEVLPLQEALAIQRRAWEARPAVRALYAEWFGMVTAQLAAVDGPTVELGAGIGSFKEYHPSVVATDIEATPWADEVMNAEALPYADSSVANLVLVDTLHHLPRPGRFLAEAQRVLMDGGRVVMLEPYASTLSTIALRLGHHEDIDTRVDPFGDVPHSSDRPLDANNALPTLIFWRHADRFASLFPKLRLVHRGRFAFLAYPLSGGFAQRRLAPDPVIRALQRLDRLLTPVGRIAAFRCLVVLEKDPSAA
jgi:SAM-dependent methyltransferase